MNQVAGRTALALCGLLALAACSPGKPAAAAGRSIGPAPAGTGRPAASAVRKSIRIGPYTQIWAGPLPADPAQATVISDFRTAQILWGRSNEALHPVAPVMSYVTGVARRDLLTALAAGRSRELVPAGTERFYLTRVAALDAGSATVTTCDDGSRYREEDPRTGRVDPASTAYPLSRDYTFMTWRMVRQGGHWAIASFSIAYLPDQRAAVCQP